MLNGMPDSSSKRPNFRWKGLITGSFILIVLLFPGVFWLRNIFYAEPREAPEAERVLSAQVGMPFQILIPAYLPKVFDREGMEIITDRSGPRGEAMIQLIYSTHKGYSLTLSEWIPNNQGPNQVASHVRQCLCICQTGKQCNMVGMELYVESVRVKVEFSTPNLLAYDQLQFVLDTLGPAANRQIYSSIEDVPLSFSVPPPVEVPIGSDGVQELILVVTPQGYSPVHFSVKKDVPVRLIFRQLGEVGCGNELIFQWGAGKSATLTLASPSDKHILEFIPGKSGEFRFNCPHLIYRGLMTVLD